MYDDYEREPYSYTRDGGRIYPAAGSFVPAMEPMITMTVFGRTMFTSMAMALVWFPIEDIQARGRPFL